MEQRTHPRFEISAACRLRWKGRAGLDGVVENMSRGGALLRLQAKHTTEVLPVVGEGVTLEIELPVNHNVARKCLRCRGTVVRVFSARRDYARVAINFRQMEFHNSPQNGIGRDAERDPAERVTPEAPDVRKALAGNGRRSGHASIEIALMAPWIFLLFLGIFDFGFYAYAAISTANAARVAALYTSSSSASAADYGTACYYALEELRRLPNVGPSVRTCTSLPVQVTASSITGVDGAAASQVSVTYQTVPLFPIPGLMGQMTITRTAQMRVLLNN